MAVGAGVAAGSGVAVGIGTGVGAGVSVGICAAVGWASVVCCTPAEMVAWMLGVAIDASVGTESDVGVTTIVTVWEQAGMAKG